MFEFGDVAGFAEDAEGAELFGGFHFALGGAAGEDDDGDFLEGRGFAEPFEEVHAGFFADSDVADDGFWEGKFGAVGIHAGAKEVGAGFAGVAADEDEHVLVLFLREGAADQEGVVGVVFDDEKGSTAILFQR